MKKNRGLISLVSIAYVGVIIVSIIFLTSPGIKNIKTASVIKEPSFDEKTAIIDEIEQKYAKLEQEITAKYLSNTEAINTKYTDLEQNIKNEYAEKEKTISKEISSKESLQNKEFFTNQFSEKYYSLRNEIDALRKEQSELEINKHKEIYNNTKTKDQELASIEKNKLSELNRLNEKKQNEIRSIDNQVSDKKDIETKGIIQIVVGCIIILIPILYVILIFNKLTHLHNRVQEKWSGVDIYLKERTDLIPNIIEAVKGYSNHEKKTLTKIAKVRKQAMDATTKEEEINANKDLSNEVKKLLFFQENYPELKADKNFMSLQNDLKEIENNISSARQIYNKEVLKYKNKLEMFPSNIVATLFKFEPELFFEINDEDKENPNIYY